MTEQDILDALRAAGFRLTTPRRKLVDVLLQAETPLSAEEVYQRARDGQSEANLSTVYRNLATFCDMGWLDAIPGANGERFYQVHSEHEHHLSVLCLDCGQLTQMAQGDAGPLNQAVRDLGFNAQTLRVTMTAHCEHVCPRREAGG